MTENQEALMAAVRELQRTGAAYRAARDRVDAAMQALYGTEPRRMADIERTAVEEG